MFISSSSDIPSNGVVNYDFDQNKSKLYVHSYLLLLLSVLFLFIYCLLFVPSLYRYLMMYIFSTYCREILVHMHNWVLTSYELLSLAPDKWVVSIVISWWPASLSAVGDHRYYFDTTFGIREVTRIMFWDIINVEMFIWHKHVHCRKSLAYVINVRDERLELLDFIDGRRSNARIWYNPWSCQCSILCIRSSVTHRIQQINPLVTDIDDVHPPMALLAYRNKNLHT